MYVDSKIACRRRDRRHSDIVAYRADAARTEWALGRQLHDPEGAVRRIRYRQISRNANGVDRIAPPECAARPHSDRFEAAVVADSGPAVRIPSNSVIGMDRTRVDGNRRRYGVSAAPPITELFLDVSSGTLLAAPARNVEIALRDDPRRRRVRTE